MERLITILTGIPIWVYPILAYGIWSGLRATRQREASLLMVLLIPVVFLGLGLWSLIPLLEHAPVVGAIWLFCGLVGTWMGWFWLGKVPVSVDRTRRVLTLSGSWVVLVTFLIVFSVKFSFGFLSATNPALVADPIFLTGIMGLSGMATGSMVGRTAKLYTAYRQVTA